MPEAELKELIEDIQKTVAEGRTENEKLIAAGKTNSEGLEKAVVDLGDLSEKVQEIKLAAEAEEEARKALEIQLARIPRTDADGKELAGTEEYKTAFNRYLRKKIEPTEEALDAEAQAYVKALGLTDDALPQMKALVVGSQPDLGFTVPIDQNRIISQRVFETSPMRSIAEVISTGFEAIQVVIDDEEFSSSWVAETDSSGDTASAQVADLEIPTHEQQAMPKATLKMLEDSTFNVESWINGKLSRKFARQENTAFITGTGVKQPTGIMTKAAWTDNEQYERGKVARQVTAASNTLDGDDLISLQTRLLEEYQDNARWLMHRLTWGLNVLTLKDTTDQYLINPQLIFTGSEFQLLGKPVTFMGDMASGVTVDNALIMAYGDFREAYTIVDRIGMTILRDPFTSKGFVKFFTRKRTGADVTNYQAYKILQVLA